MKENNGTLENSNINEEYKNNSENSDKDTNNEDQKENKDILKIDEEKEKLSDNKNKDENLEKDKIKKIEQSNRDISEEKENNTHYRSILSLEGAKYPLSIYTRRVMNISRIKEYLNEDSTAGVCGGYNLGNTCFMNSSIACFSNCTELTYYFLCGDYEKDINYENKNGMQGELAKAWGELLQQYWIENTNIGNPREFKNTIGQKAIRFRGYGQQDSNEFMNIFLDNLNEDLNSADKKEYIELDEQKEDETDEICSKRFWDSNLKRNDSIITDLFCGQFKSTITCPNCNWVSITYEPFYSINLPLKEKKSKKKEYIYEKDLEEYQFFYVPKFGLRSSYKICVEDIPSTTQLKECFKMLKNDKNFKYKGRLKQVKYIKINNRLIECEKEGDELIEEYSQNIFLYEVNNEEDNDLTIPIYFLKKYDEGEKNLTQYPRFVFGKEDMTLEQLKKNIYFIVRKYTLSPFLKCEEEIDEISELINKSKTDMNIDDDNLFNLIDKEYQKIINEIPTQKDIRFLQDYIKDIPFTLTLRDIMEDKVIKIFDDDNINLVHPNFQQLTKVSSMKTSIKDIIDKNNDFLLVVEFNETSKYINKNNFFKLDNCFVKKMIFPKKEEEKDEEKKEEDNHKPDLNECLKYFCQEEQLNKGNYWHCKNCGSNVLPKKKIDIYYLPKILIICFKRFIKESSSWEKNEEDIDFPINNYDMKDFIIGPDKEHSIYDLFAVSQHYGSNGFGHYTAVCKNGDKWYNYDDSSVTETNPESALSPAAYVLFYRRQTD